MEEAKYECVYCNATVPFNDGPCEQSEARREGRCVVAERKSMLDDDSRYRPVAQALSAEVTAAVEPILRKYGMENYCPREIGIVANEAVNTTVGLMLMIPLNKRTEELSRWR